MEILQLTSKIDKVKVYSRGSSITRITSLELKDGTIPEQVEIIGLPLTLDDSSVRARVETNSATAAMVTGIGISVAVPSTEESEQTSEGEDLTEAKVRVRRLEESLKLIDKEIEILTNLKIPDRPLAKQGKAPPISPTEARLEIINFKNEQIRSRIQEKRDIEEELYQAVVHLAGLQETEQKSSTDKKPRSQEIRKVINISLSYSGEAATFVGQNLIIEYYIPGAHWAPAYVLRFDSEKLTVSIALRALICQRSGEDWLGVALELSTAEPLSWCDLPELTSLRIGRAQPSLHKRGWRKPPIGTETLFVDYDNYRESSISKAREDSLEQELKIPKLPPLLNLEDYQVGEYSVDGDFSAYESQDFDYAYRLQAPVEAIDMPSAPPPMAAAAPKIAQNQIRTKSSRALKLTPGKNTDNIITAQGRGTLGESSQITQIQDFVKKYNSMRLTSPNDKSNRGKLYLMPTEEIYREFLESKKARVNINILAAIDESVSLACVSVPLPVDGVYPRQLAGNFDYAYNADGRVDIPSDAQFHSVALTSTSTSIEWFYVVVPREDTNVFRFARLRNPIEAPLLQGNADIYVDGEYLFSHTIPTIPSFGEFELGLGVEEAIKVARNTSYKESSYGIGIAGVNKLHHSIDIEIVNYLPKKAKIFVRERIPVAVENTKVEVEIDEVSPQWQKYEQKEREAPIEGGYQWVVELNHNEKKNLKLRYTIKIPQAKEIISGNRRE